jgi:tetraacyldisaccharide 4'-kinase
VHPVDVLRGRRVVGFAGIGRPSAFRKTLEAAGAEVIGFTGFADHHRFVEDELRGLERQASAAGPGW